MATSRYVTVEEIKRRMQKTDDTDDLIIFQLAEAAANAIDNFCNRPDGFVAPDSATTRYYTGNGEAYLLIDECVAITAVAVKDTAEDTDYEAWASPTTNMAGDGDWFAFTGDREAPDYNGLPYTALMVDPNGDYTHFTDGRYTGLRGFRQIGDVTIRSLPTVRVTARWGHSASVPYEIREACAMQTMRWYKRAQGAMTSTLAIAELGTLEIYNTLDPDIEFILRLGRYRKPVSGRK